MRYDILDWIWRGTNPRGGNPFMAIIDRNNGAKFHEQRIVQGMAYLEQETPGQDLFFTPLVYDGARNNENARGFDLLYADLDHMNADLLHKMWPHLLWQTGPETTQGIWKLSAPLPSHDAWADLNQRMTYFMDADKGGWHASKLLRVPETINYKYDPPFQGRVWSWQPKAVPYEAEALRAALPVLEDPKGEVWEGRPTAPDQAQWREYIRLMWPHLSLGSRAALMQGGAKDRSRFLIGVVNKLLAEGHSPAVVFQLMWGTAYNKFRTDRHRPDYLWQLINRRP